MKKKILFAAACLLFVSGCSAVQRPAFNPKTCLSDAPNDLDGLVILKGDRTKESVIQDMQIAYCNAQMLMKKQYDMDKSASPGAATFRVTVEYNGEVISSKVIGSNNVPKDFVYTVNDFIKDSDFTPWKRSDTDTDFVYPMTFDRWW